MNGYEVAARQTQSINLFLHSLTSLLHSHFNLTSFLFKRERKSKQLKRKSKQFDWSGMVRGRGAAAHNPQKKRNKLLFFNQQHQSNSLSCFGGWWRKKGRSMKRKEARNQLPPPIPSISFTKRDWLELALACRLTSVRWCCVHQFPSIHSIHQRWTAVQVEWNFFTPFALLACFLGFVCSSWRSHWREPATNPPIKQKPKQAPFSFSPPANWFIDFTLLNQNQWR